MNFMHQRIMKIIAVHVHHESPVVLFHISDKEKSSSTISAFPFHHKVPIVLNSRDRQENLWLPEFSHFKNPDFSQKTSLNALILP